MKLFLKILAALMGVVLVAVLALVFLLDANVFKPRLEALAREQGLPLTIEGDLDWQLLPALGIEVKGITIDDPVRLDKLAQIGRASLGLALRPLLRGEVEVHHLVVDRAHVNLVVDEAGQGNWQNLLGQPEAAANPRPEAGTREADTPLEEQAQRQLRLAVEQISLTDSSLSYAAHSAEGEPLQLSLQDIQLHVDDFNLQGRAFPLSLAWQTQLGVDAPALNAELKGRLQFPSDFSQIRLDQSQLRLRPEGVNPLELKFQVSAENLQEQLSYTGEVALAPINARELIQAFTQAPLATASAEALTRIALDARFSGSDQHLTLAPFSVHLDDTRLQGRLALPDFSQGAVEVTAEGGQLNLDDYLPPREEQAETAPSTEDTPLPLEPLRGLVATLSLDLDTLVVAETPLRQLHLRLSADEGLIQLQEARAQVYQGEAVISGQLDARGDNAIVKMQSQVEGLQLAPLLRDRALDENLDLRGAVYFSADLTTRGTSANQLVEAADAQISFSGDQVRLAPLNVEHKFCEIVGLVTGQQPAGNWPPFTEIQELAGKAQLADQVVRLQQVTAGVERLRAALEGHIDLGQGRYDLKLPLTLTREDTSDTGCRVQSNFWLDRRISLLRCQGSLQALDPASDCRPDSRGLAALTRNFAQYQLEKQHGDRIDAAEQKLDKQKDELRRKVEEELGGENAREVEERLKNLLRR